MDEAVDGGLEINDGMEDAVFEPTSREFCEETLDGGEPGGGWREVEGPAWMAGEPSVDFVFLMRRVVVEDHVDGLVRRHLALDAVEEADKLLMTMALHVLPDDRSIQNVNSPLTKSELDACGPVWFLDVLI